jgi:hypothetical protein
MESEPAKAIIVPGGSVDTEGFTERLPMKLQLFDQDGNPVDLSGLLAFASLFDFTGAQDGYILAFDAVKGKYVPLPLSSTQGS